MTKEEALKRIIEGAAAYASILQSADVLDFNNEYDERAGRELTEALEAYLGKVNP